MLTQIIEQSRPKMEKGIERFREENNKLRTGRANPAMVENLSVDYSLAWRSRKIRRHHASF